ncbi:MAG: hypothetical protein ABI920_06610 [Casimicrobiaceae bacterium]
MTMLGRFYTLKSLGIGFRCGRSAVLQAGIAGACDDGRRGSTVGTAMWHENGKKDPWKRLRAMFRVAVTAGVLGLLGGCAANMPRVDKDTPQEQKQKIVAERAEARWQALIKGDLDSAYSYLSPASRAANSLTLYKGKVKPGIWRAAKADRVSCLAEVCTVTMLVTIDTKAMKGIQAPVTENWILEDGAAWFVYR